MYRYNYDYQASVEGFLNFKWTLVIADILEMNVPKRNCLSLTYMPDGFENPYYIILSLKDIEVEEIIEEIIKRG